MRFLVVLAILFAACGGAVGSGGPSPSIPAEARGALAQVFVDGHSYTLQVDLYRDLMPGPAPTPRRGLGGTIFLRADVESTAPAGLESVKAWLVKGDEVWETVPFALQTFTVDRRMHLSLGVRDGPTWDPGSKVDVILQFATSTGTYFIQQRAVDVIGAL
ncbi:MAG TPA: hypothetical protein VIA63_08935 [Candidatus Limnocylindria bacterium]